MVSSARPPESRERDPNALMDELQKLYDEIHGIGSLLAASFPERRDSGLDVHLLNGGQWAIQRIVDITLEAEEVMIRLHHSLPREPLQAAPGAAAAAA